MLHAQVDPSSPGQPGDINTEPANTENTAPSETYPLRGVVLNSVNHQPIARALVDAQQDAAFTDNEGRFELHLPSGTVALQPQRPGYNSGRVEPTQVVNVGPGQPDVTLYLRPDAIITGIVTLSNGDTADGIPITASRRTTANGRRLWQPQQMVSTNSEGAFRIAALEPGEYMVSSTMQRDQGSSLASGYGYPTVYYPGVSDPSAASILTLTAGQHAQADLPLARQKFYPIAVKLEGLASGDGAVLQLREAGGRDVGASIAVNPREGTAETSAPNGNYYLEGRSYNRSGAGRSGAYGRVDFRVASAPVIGVTLTMLPLHPIAVNVRKDFKAETSADRQQMAVNGAADPAAQPMGLNLILTPAEDQYGQGSDAGGNLTPVKGSNDNTAFQLASVEPGKYWVMTYPFLGYVSSITSGGQDLAREPLIVGPGSTTAAIEVTLRDDTGTISGRVTRPTTSATSGPAPASTPVNGTLEIGLPQLYVYAIPLFPYTGQLMETRTFASGEFTVPNLPPGLYRVVVFETAHDIEYHSPEALARYSSMGQTITVEAGGTANIQIDSIATTSGDTQ